MLCSAKASVSSLQAFADRDRSESGSCLSVVQQSPFCSFFFEPDDPFVLVVAASEGITSSVGVCFARRSSSCP